MNKTLITWIRRPAVLLLSAVLLASSGCSSKPDYTMEFSVNDDGEYHGFDTLVEHLDDYSVRDALRGGCYVCKDEKLSGGRQSYDAFINSARERANSSCRFLHFYEDQPTQLMDVYFHRMNYYVFLYDAEHTPTKGHCFSNYQVITGTLPGEDFIRTYCVVTNLETLTFEDILPTLLEQQDTADSSSPDFCILLQDDMWLGLLG